MVMELYLSKYYANKNLLIGSFKCKSLYFVMFFLCRNLLPTNELRIIM